MFNPSRLQRAVPVRGYTKSYVAKVAEPSTRQLSNYEKGTQQPTVETLARLASELGFPVPSLRLRPTLR